MEELYGDINKLISSNFCTHHLKFPAVEIVNGKIVMVCCCTDFKYKCHLELVAFLNEKKAENKVYN